MHANSNKAKHGEQFVHHSPQPSNFSLTAGEAGGSSKSRTPHEEQAAHETPDIVRQLLAGASAAPEHGMDSSIASEPDVAHLLLEAAREANADLARDAETDANMLEVSWESQLTSQLHASEAA